MSAPCGERRKHLVVVAGADLTIAANGAVITPLGFMPGHSGTPRALRT